LLGLTPIETNKKMKKSKQNWLWNIIIGLTLIVCVSAFVLHYKNWSKIEEDHLQIVSGIYKQRILLAEIDSLGYVEKLPQMERKNGFSWLAKEKGIFKDSLTTNETYVFVDDLRQQKIRIVHHDSLKLFLNFTDSLETAKMFETIKQAIESSN